MTDSQIFLLTEEGGFLLFPDGGKIIIQDVPVTTRGWRTIPKSDPVEGNEILTPDGYQILVGDPEYSVLRWAEGESLWTFKSKS